MLSFAHPSFASALFQGACVLVLLGVGAGCSEIDFAEQDLALHYLQEADRIELSVDTRGLFPTSSDWGESQATVVTKSKERVEAMAAGARYLYLVTFPFILDLDREQPEDDEWLTREQITRAWDLFQDSVSVSSAKAFLDDMGEVALTQQVEIKNASACVAAVNEIITAGVLHELKGTTEKPGEVYGSDASRKNLRAFADAGREWVSLDKDALVVRVPMTPQDLALALKELVAERRSAEDSSEEASWSERRGGAASQALLGNLQDLEVKDGVVTLRFAADDTGRIRWRFQMPRHPDAQKLVAAFDAEELK